MKISRSISITLTAVTVGLFMFVAGGLVEAQTNPQSGAIGINGTVPTDPPTQGATITFPTSGSTTNPATDVVGVCPNGLLVKIFKNEVFSGSVLCENGSFSVEINLFSGENEIVARVFDALDQPGPDSNIVTLTLNNAGSSDADRVSLTTNFAQRGANPNETLSWPFTITGGTGPYAVSIQWGDGEEQLLSFEFAGEFIAEHIYETPGTYKIIVRVTDANGTTSFLQVVGVANGAIQDSQATNEGGAALLPVTGGNGFRVVMWPLYIMIFLIFSTFWLGRRYEIKKLKQKLASQQSIYR